MLLMNLVVLLLDVPDDLRENMVSEIDTDDGRGRRR